MSRPAVELRAPTPADLTELAENLRAQDRAELDASGWTDYAEALDVATKTSRWSRAATINGELACVFGCAEHGSLLAPSGVPWLLGTDVLPRHRRVLQQWAPRYIAAMLQEYPRLYNAVHVDNTVAVHWLERLGFKMHPATPVPPNGAMFRIFEMTRHV
jgi:hypothetical protein